MRSVVANDTMREKQQKAVVKLPYQPILFVYSGTMGEKQQLEQNRFDMQMRDILIPNTIDKQPALYVLFHTPPIYNWLRTTPCNQSFLLNKYICSTVINTKHCFNVDSIYSLLQKYIEKWEIARLAFCAKVYVKEGGCEHFSKRNVHTSQYQCTINNLICPQLSCKVCHLIMKVTTNIVECPMYLLLKQPITKKNALFHSYKLILFYTANNVYINVGNFVWYCVSDSVNIVKENYVPFKQAALFLYSPTNVAQSQILTKAKSFIVKDAIKQNDSKRQIQRQQNKKQTSKQQKQLQNLKELNFKDEKTIYKQRNTLKKSEVKQQKLFALKIKENKLNLTNKQLQKQYQRHVNSLIPRQKIKDQYQLEYEKGKLKKIKQKKIYLKPDFNVIYDEVRRSTKERQNISPKPRKRVRDREQIDQ